MHGCAMGGSPAQPSPDEEGGAEAAVTFVFWLSSVWSKSCLGIVGLFLGSLGSVWSHYLARASRSPHPLRWSRDHPVPFPQEMPSSQPPPASSLEVPVVVLPERLQDDGDNRHEGFHNAELKRGLHRGETPCTGQE